MRASLVRAGFRKQRFDAGEAKLNYVEGPDRGPPLLLIPAQMGTWESYELVLVALSKIAHVYVVDVRGHGESSWTTGRYDWNVIGADFAAFLQKVVRRPAIVSGNSSGGIIALWLAAREPSLVRAVVLEDAPVFSVEMPRFAERDRFVYAGLAHLVRTIGDPAHRDLAQYFAGQEMPIKQGAEVKTMPPWLLRLLSWAIARREKAHPNEPVDVWWFPRPLRLLVKSLSMFDPDFSRAFVDGRFYVDFDHAKALAAVRCPMLVMHADWFRHERFGLVGAMDAEDAARIRSLVPQAKYVIIPAQHVIHAFAPQRFIEEMQRFIAALPPG